MCFAALLTQIPSLQEKFHISDADLTWILLLVPVVAGVGSVLAGLLTPKLGSAIVLRFCGPGVCVAIFLVGVTPSRTLLYGTLCLVGLGLGSVDATMNMQGVAVQRRYGRSILASFHGVWSVGGILGSLATSGGNRVHLGIGLTLGLVALVGVLLDVPLGVLLLRRPEEQALEPDPGKPLPKIPWAPIVLVGLAVLLMYVADSATSNWSTVYLHDALHASHAVAPLGVSAYLTFQVIGRLVADRPIHRFGPVLPVVVGSLVGGVGMTIVATAPSPAVGIFGFAVVGFGLCVVVPLSFSAADSLDPASSGVAISRINLFNYVGYIVGAGLVGAINSGAGLRWAYGVVAILASLIVGLAPSFKIARAAVSGQVPVEA
jgi:MFS family permease